MGRSEVDTILNQALLMTDEERAAIAEKIIASLIVRRPAVLRSSGARITLELAD